MHFGPYALGSTRKQKQGLRECECPAGTSTTHHTPHQRLTLTPRGAEGYWGYLRGFLLWGDVPWRARAGGAPLIKTRGGPWFWISNIPLAWQQPAAAASGQRPAIWELDNGKFKDTRELAWCCERRIFTKRASSQAYV